MEVLSIVSTLIIDNGWADCGFTPAVVGPRPGRYDALTDIELSWPGVDQFLVDHLTSWGIKEFTDVQAKALCSGIASGCSMVVCSPTSSGKTLVGEIAALVALRAGVRVIYLVSHKALADQKYLDFIGRFGERAPDPIASVGLNTGDRAEGDINAHLMIATYEKAFGLILSGQIDCECALVVADELQILGDPSRGSDIEALCSIFRQREIRQFVALTATVENPEDIAGWMKCGLVRSSQRDVPLHQEIWFDGRVYRITFGQSDGEELQGSMWQEHDVESVVDQLLKQGRGPVLVFTESRREAADYAARFGQTRPRAREGLALAEQLDLFSEPTESSEQLRENAEKKVTFHTADLSPQERQVIEAGFSASRFEVCFATSTLAAGVNFPFRTIVFPKLTFQWGDRAGSLITLSDYRNMSGRAGRLGMHSDGCAVLLPCNKVELAHANKLVLPTNDRLESQMVNLSLRKSILTLVASGIASDRAGVSTFFQNTLYWYQTLDKNPSKLAKLSDRSEEAIHWLVANSLLEESQDTLLITPLGKMTALSGLLPSTAVSFAGMLMRLSSSLAGGFEECIPGLIYSACASEEFRGSRPSRFLPYPSRTSYDSFTYWSTKKLPVSLNRADTQLAQCSHAVALFVEGLAERKIAHATLVSSGAVHHLAVDVAWVLDGLHKVATVPDFGCPQTLSNQIALLARRVRCGAPAEALDMIRVAERHRVPGFGRQRAMALISQGIASLHDILATAKDKLVQLLRSGQRAQALLEAASTSIGHTPDRLATTHRELAKRLGIAQLVDECNQTLGVDYEKAITRLLNVETTWSVTVLDDGVRQNVPDLLVELGQTAVLIECKTCTKSPALIKKDEAWAVLQKAADFDRSMWRVTLGKPVFDETCKKKVATSDDITLVEHSLFMEGLLRVHSGSLAPSEFLEWLSKPGLAEIERLGGTPTFSV